jgi:hypothetical protein
LVKRRRESDRDKDGFQTKRAPMRTGYDHSTQDLKWKGVSLKYSFFI